MTPKQIIKHLKDDFELAKRLSYREEGETILRIREILPSVQCRRGCSKCCEDLGVERRFFFSKWEWDQVRDKRQFTGSGDCPYLVYGRCEIYHDRPLICRVYGVTPGSRLACKQGCVPLNPADMDTYRSVERFRFVLMLRAMSRRERKDAYKKIVTDIKSGNTSQHQRGLQGYMENWT